MFISDCPPQAGSTWRRLLMSCGDQGCCWGEMLLGGSSDCWIGVMEGRSNTPRVLSVGERGSAGTPKPKGLGSPESACRG